MIQKVVGYKVGDQFFPTIEDAQKLELIQLMPDLTEVIAKAILANKDKVIDILTMRPTSRPRARKANGATRKRKASPEAINAELQDSKQ